MRKKMAIELAMHPKSKKGVLNCRIVTWLYFGIYWRICFVLSYTRNNIHIVSSSHKKWKKENPTRWKSNELQFYYIIELKKAIENNILVYYA
jgi:hypothetical protein